MKGPCILVFLCIECFFPCRVPTLMEHIALNMDANRLIYPRDTQPEFKMWGGASKTRVINLSTSL